MAHQTISDLERVNSVSSIYDAISPIIKKKVKDPSTFQKFLKVFRDFTSKNESKLNTNIVGRQVILNSKMENDILDIFGIERNYIKNLIVESEYFKKFGKELTLTDQLCLAIPLMVASLEYKNINKIDQSKLVYLFAFFKPYSSRESFLFKYGVNDSQMLYTIEKCLTDRFDIKTLKTVFLAIQKKSESSYNNYIENYKSNDVITDKDLHIIYSSGIATRMNHFIGSIFEEYMKNSGKRLEFEDSGAGILDKDNDTTEYEDNDIQSDIAIKNSIVNKVVSKITKDPIDKGIVMIACQAAYGTSAKNYTQMLSTMIDEIIDHMFDKLPEFFSAVIGSFLFHVDPSSRKMYTMKDFKTPVFLSVGIDLLSGKKSHLKDTNMVISRKIFGEMLENYSEQYKTFGETYRRSMRKALATYWVCLIKSVS